MGIGTQSSSALEPRARHGHGAPARPKDVKEEAERDRERLERREGRVAFTILKQKWDFYRFC